ncbi:helix-turn-helix transcriptional regulator [Pedobacter polaris]|uniref:Helix-turn-helix transcriptional regulator n=1 Tax=Pedobacter polaris TaxID=2571273 RepID=A0A4U1CID7_9SPHI|nr:AraC family transcriptional regulator [Pedobacter polaris]TKC06658.1 helix-turn-helix transcriptional regulator [Pedobacter polaris]
MYFTSLPDHSQVNFDEEMHFSRFKKHNIIFNTVSDYSYCDDHVGCLSFKTILSGEEWYVVNNRRIAVRPGQFLILNDEQNYSCSIDQEKVKGFSVFFKKEFATEVFRDEMSNEETILDNPFNVAEKSPEFFQTLKYITPDLQLQLTTLISALENDDFHAMTDEKLVFLLEHLIRSHQSDTKRIDRVAAIKLSSKIEIYKRLCIAKDLLHSTFMDSLDLHTLSITACLSVPQLIRQFKSVFQVTPHQYLIALRLKRAVELLKFSHKPINEITWECGFENVSAFCRAFKTAYGAQPLNYRKTSSLN